MIPYHLASHAIKHLTFVSLDFSVEALCKPAHNTPLGISFIPHLEPSID